MSEPWYKTAFGPQYPLLYGHRNQAEAEKCLELLLQMMPLKIGSRDPYRILDLGCGDGRHLTSLPGKSHGIIGLDFSPELLKLAQEKISLSHVTSLVLGDMSCLPFRPQTFSAIFSLFTAFGYFGSLADNRHVVQGIAQTLVPGGHWYFDYFDCDRVKEELAPGVPKTRKRTEGPLEIEEVRTLDLGGDVVRKNVIMTSSPGQEKEALRWGVSGDGLNYTEEVAVFSQPEIRELTAGYDLVPVATAGSYDGVPLGQGDRWLMVFRKVKK